MLEILFSGSFWLPFLAYFGPFAGLVYVVVFVTFEFLMTRMDVRGALHEELVRPQRSDWVSFVVILKSFFMVFTGGVYADSLDPVFGAIIWRQRGLQTTSMGPA